MARETRRWQSLVMRCSYYGHNQSYGRLLCVLRLMKRNTNFEMYSVFRLSPSFTRKNSFETVLNQLRNALSFLLIERPSMRRLRRVRLA